MKHFQAINEPVINALLFWKLNMNEEKFQVQVKRKGREYIKCSINFDQSAEETENADDTIESLDDRFATLARDWTGTAINFFEVFPVLSTMGFLYADRDLQETTIKRVREVAEHLEVDDDGEVKTETFTLDMRELGPVAKGVAKSHQLLNTANTLKRSALGSLISEYEAFIGELLILVSVKCPEAFLDANSEIKLVDLDDYDTIEELKQAQLENALDDLTHGKSHLDILKFIEGKFKVNLTSDATLIAEFVEVCQRRHLIMHAGSKVNKRYLRICREAGFPADQLPEIGETVTISRKYLRRATARVYQMGFFTLQLLWQKILGSWENSDWSVLSASHDFLEADLTKMARRVSVFSIGRVKNRPHNRCHAYLLINLAQSYLFDRKLTDEDRNSKIQSVLQQRDWSMKSPLIELAIACLNEDYVGIKDKVVSASKVGDHTLSYQDVFMWNIFRNAQSNSEFMEGVVEAFGEVGVLASNTKTAIAEG